MKTIIKIMGLPRTGTNLLNLVTALNFKEYTCLHDRYLFDVDYLGWKHHYAPDIKTINLIEERTQESIIFLFTFREFSNWESAILKKHNYRGEFLTRWQKDLKNGPIIYNTPHGPKFYYNLRQLYDDYNNSYEQFIKNNPKKSMAINYEELAENQSKIILSIKKYFSILELTYNKPIPILKKVNSEGQLEDYKNG